MILEKKSILIILSVVIIGVVFFAGPAILGGGSLQPVVEGSEITVFYSPGCSCCVEYIPYLKRKGFIVSENNDFGRRIDILEENQIPSEMTSCHVSMIDGYFVEGHVPAEIIAKLLDEKPNIDGIALPGMPDGTPGMPGIKNEKWIVYGFLNGEAFEYITL